MLDSKQVIDCGFYKVEYHPSNYSGPECVIISASSGLVNHYYRRNSIEAAEDMEALAQALLNIAQGIRLAKEETDLEENLGDA